MISVAIAYGIFVFPKLPARVPIHWNAQGQADGWGTPVMAVVVGPALMVFIFLLLAGLPFLAPKDRLSGDFGEAYHTIMVIVMGLFLVIDLVITTAGAGAPIDVTRLLMSSLFLAFALLGTRMRRVKRNRWVGVRTPWTLRNDEVWREVHRRAASLWTWMGVIGGILSLVALPFWGAFALFMGIALFPVVDSYFVAKRIEGN